MPTRESAELKAELKADFKTEPSFKVDELYEEARREGFNINGQPVEYDSPECVAKRLTDLQTNRSRFFIKACNSGPDAGHFYNPKSMYGMKSTSRGGLPAFVWVTVNLESFDNYMRFLATGNVTYFRESERHSCQN